MSRLIKAPHALTESSNKKAIQLKPISSHQTKDENSAAHTEDDTAAMMEYELQEKLGKVNEQQEAAVQLKEQAKRELEQTRKQISEEEQESKQRIEQAFSKAKENGYAEGFEQGVNDGKASYDEAIEEVKAIIHSAKQEYTSYLEKAEPVILDLALAVANRVIYKSLEDEDGTWLEIVKNAVQEVKDHEDIAIYVPISRYEETKQQRQEIENVLTYSKELLLLPDGHLSEDQCIIETSYGRVDASLDSQLDELKNKLQDMLKEGRPDESS
ncbi:flagellar assembly protein FliH [Alteribacillus sp. YIM 98480]|uniref:flagellar assembly protein FliH n=1 Tax=Alteribacillus sp. YIM 98480 TaxID=2606599 RepID=UPI00131BC9A5|nr:flagellar assembly protein FliH [Alteribacillus sp. YIM 98480]